MLFNSYEFLFFFLPIVLVVYYALPFRAKAAWLTAVSYIFYGWWSPSFCLLLLTSTVIDFVAGKGIHRSESAGARRGFLLVSLVANLSLLGFFKYYDFLAEALNLAGGGAFDIPIFNIILPVGISFYTFQSLSYSIDIYRRQATPADSFVDFAQYVSLFPQLLAGPIVRYAWLAEQMRHRDHTVSKAARGARLFIIGLAKKTLVADTFALAADAYFLQPEPGLLNSWVGVYSFGLQVYFDFSGYSDMALGLGLMLGYEFPINFDSPYKSTSVAEIWRRWHISLSNWLRDYVYIPLGGNRVGATRAAINVIITMFLCGVWHGAAWTFVLFGFYHGVAIALYRGWRHLRGDHLMPDWLARALTFAFWLSSMPLFRADDLPDALVVMASLIGLHGLGTVGFLPDPLVCIALFMGGVAVFTLPNSNENLPGPGWARLPALVLLFWFSLAAIFINDETPFIYYQF